MRIRAIVLACIGLFFLASCGDDAERRKKQLEQLKTTAIDQGKKAIDEVSSPELAEDIKRLIPAVEKKDLPKLKTVTTDLDLMLSTDVMGCYYRAFAIESESGPKAAQQYLADKLSDPAVGEDTKRPLRGLNSYFTIKGTVTTKDAALMVLGITIEIKFRGGGKLVFPFMDDPPPNF